MSRVSVLIAFCLLAALALAAACGGDGDGGPSGVELPEGFPGDFPLYEKATVSVATLAPEGGRFLVSMETEDSADEVRVFYERELGEDPWQVDNVVEIPGEEIEETVVIEFARADSGEEWGTVAIAIVQEDGQYVTIALSLFTSQ